MGYLYIFLLVIYYSVQLPKYAKQKTKKCWLTIEKVTAMIKKVKFFEPQCSYMSHRSTIRCEDLTCARKMTSTVYLDNLVVANMELN